MASWTRAEGMGFAFVLILVIVALGYLFFRLRPSLLAWLTPIGIFVLPWLMISGEKINQSHLGGAVRGFLPLFFSGQLNFWELYLIPRLFLDRALDINQWGLLMLVGIPILVFGMPKSLPGQNRERFLILSIVIAAALVVIGLFYVRSYTRPSDFYQLLNRSFDRALLPAAFLMIYALIRSFEYVNDKSLAGKDS